MKVYGLALSPPTRTVMAVLNEKGVNFDLVDVNLLKKEHKLPEHLKLQPFGQIPAIDDEGLVLFESRAIARYLCNKFEGVGPDLLGSSLAARARVDQWLEVEAQTYFPQVYGILRERIFKPYFGRTSNEDIVARYKVDLNKVLDVYEAHLSGAKYLAGDEFSLADLVHLPTLEYLIQAGESDLLYSRPHVKAWWEEISSRPAWKKVLGSN